MTKIIKALAVIDEDGDVCEVFADASQSEVKCKQWADHYDIGSGDFEVREIDAVEIDGRLFNADSNIAREALGHEV